MKLSEAIRLGAMATEKGTGSESILSDVMPCALGAARLAAGIKCDEESEAFRLLQEQWPITQTVVNRPTTDIEFHDQVEDRATLLSMIWQLNDCSNWTRAQIADWVEAIERHAPQVECVPVSAMEPADDSRALAQK